MHILLENCINTKISVSVVLGGLLYFFVPLDGVTSPIRTLFKSHVRFLCSKAYILYIYYVL